MVWGKRPTYEQWITTWTPESGVGRDGALEGGKKRETHERKRENVGVGGGWGGMWACIDRDQLSSVGLGRVALQLPRHLLPSPPPLLDDLRLTQAKHCAQDRTNMYTYVTVCYTLLCDRVPHTVIDAHVMSNKHRRTWRILGHAG